MKKTREKRRRGRPLISDDDIRDHILNFRLNIGEVAEIDYLCAATQEKSGTIIRRLIAKEVKRLKKKLTDE
jgi:hypothetical protein